MPISVVCQCGKTLQVGDDLAGKRVRCPACKDVVKVEERPAEEEEPEAMEVEDCEVMEEEPDCGVTCYSCGVSAKCKRIHFWSAKAGKVDKRGQIWTGMVKVEMKNLQRHEITVCRRCLIEEAGKSFLPWVKVSLAAAALCVVFGFFGLVANNKGGREMLGGAIFWACILAGLAYFFKRKVENPTITKTFKEEYAIRLAHREIMENTDANRFFTTESLNHQRVK